MSARPPRPATTVEDRLRVDLIHSGLDPEAPPSPEVLARLATVLARAEREDQARGNCRAKS